MCELSQSKSTNENEADNTISNEANNKPAPILMGSGEDYYLCYRRQASDNDLIKPITDIQVISDKSVFPLTYKALNHTYYGQRLPYFQKPINGNNDNNPKNPNRSRNGTDEKVDSSHDPNKSDKLDLPNQNNGVSGNLPQSPSNGNVTPRGDNVGNSTAARGGASMGPDVGSSAGKSGRLIDAGVNGGDSLLDNEQGAPFHGVPLIVYSRSGHSPITNVKYVKIGQTMHAHGCYVTLRKTLDGNEGDLNSGANNERRYITFAKDLTPYRFSAEELDMQLSGS